MLICVGIDVKFVIPAVLAATIMIAGIFAMIQVDNASSSHNSQYINY